MPYDPSGIADAVAAFSRAILRNNGTLAFGSHPTITPLVLMIARELCVKDSVDVFQSAWFKEQRHPEVDGIENEKLGCVHWTPDADDQDEALQTMRQEMIKHTRYAGALFIGGMDGIGDEYRMVKKIWPETPCIPVAGPGGAAAHLPMKDCEALGLASFNRSKAYPYMGIRFVEALS